MEESRRNENKRKKGSREGIEMTKSMGKKKRGE